MSRRIEPKVIFDGIPVAPNGGTPGAAFTVGTYYIPIPFAAAGASSLHLQGDGTAVATATVQHTDFTANLDGTTVDPRVAGVGSVWSTDAAIGPLTIAASTGPTGGARVTWSNQPRALSRIVLVVTTGGRIRGAATGVM